MASNSQRPSLSAAQAEVLRSLSASARSISSEIMSVHCKSYTQEHVELSTLPLRRKKVDGLEHLEKILTVNPNAFTFNISYRNSVGDCTGIWAAREHSGVAGFSVMFANDCANRTPGLVPNNHLPECEPHAICACLSPLPKLSLNIIGWTPTSNAFKLGAFLNKEPYLISAIFKLRLKAWGVLRF